MNASEVSQISKEIRRSFQYFKTIEDFLVVIVENIIWRTLLKDHVNVKVCSLDRTFIR